MIDRAMAPAADADITPFGISFAEGEPPLVLQLGWGCAWTISSTSSKVTPAGRHLRASAVAAADAGSVQLAAGAEDRRFTPSLWHVRKGATCEDAG
jgi:hypothetical protein